MQRFTFSTVALLLFVSFSSLGQMPANLQSGLVAYYPFSGNAGDSSGNNNHGTAINTVSYVSDHNGKINSAIGLTGGYNGGRVTTNSNMFKFKFTDSFSIAFWFLDAGSNSSNGRIISTENPEGNFRIGSSAGGIYAVQFGGGSDVYLYDTVIPNQWNHIVYTFNNRSVKSYKNGVLKTTQTNTSTEILNYGTPFTIGSKAASAYDSWNGKIDEVAVWNRAITPTEVAQLYSGSTLPLKLISFTANESNNGVLLKWQTENETNFSHFEIEHSNDGLSFSKLAATAGYSYVHGFASKAVNYYRLKVVDKDGKFAYSPIVKIQLKDKSLVQIYPNPVKNFTTVSINSNKAEVALITITDATGKMVLQEKRQLLVGKNDLGINTELFISGIYQLSICSSNAKQTIKLIKQ